MDSVEWDESNPGNGKNDRPWYIFSIIYKSIIIVPYLFWANALLTTKIPWITLSYVNFFTHEFGHVFFSVLGQFMHVLGGNLFESLVPLLITIIFIIKRKWFVSQLFLFWFGDTLIEASVYIGDARSRSLPLVNGLGIYQNSVEGHDWHWILGTLNMLPYDRLIASIVRLLGSSFIIVSLAAVFVLIGIDMFHALILKRSKKENAVTQSDSNNLLL